MNQLENLKNQIVSRQILLDDLTKRAAMLQALYDYEKGVLEIRRMETYYECMALKQKMEIIQSYRKPGKGISATLMDSMLSAQRSDHSYILEELREKTRQAKASLDALQPESQRYQACKAAYRSVLEHSGPDDYLESARKAYLENDLETLQTLAAKPPEHSSEEEQNLEQQLEILDGCIADLMESGWLQQEETLMDEERAWLQPMEDECAYYEKIREEMESLIQQTGRS